MFVFFFFSTSRLAQPASNAESVSETEPETEQGFCRLVLVLFVLVIYTKHNGSVVYYN